MTMIRERPQTPVGLSEYLRDLENHWRLPAGVLSCGELRQAALGRNAVIWTPTGGIVSATLPELASRLSDLLRSHLDADCPTIWGQLQAMLKASAAVSSSSDVFLYCADPPRLFEADQRRIDLVAAEELWGKGNAIPGVESVYAIKDDGRIVSHAYSLPQAVFSGRQFHAVGAATHRDFRRRGLGKAVVAALVSRIVAQNGVALWCCAAENASSYQLARSLGFVEAVRHFEWKHAQ